MSFDRRGDDRRPQTARINQRIRVPEVRLIGADGGQAGVVPTHRALAMAQEAGLDLVEVDSRAAPPVCKILDFGKKKFEDAKKAREAKKAATVVEVKELTLRPKTDDHDIGVKVAHARRFIEEGNKVKFTVRFRGREITHPHIAQAQLTTVVKALEDVATVEMQPRMEGRAMFMQVGPRPAVMQRAQQARRQQA